MARMNWLIRGLTTSDPALNTALTRSVWNGLCRSNKVTIFMKALTVTGTTPSLSLMPQVDLGGVFTDMLAAPMVFDANDLSFQARVLSPQRLPASDAQFRVVATAKSGTTPGVTGLDVIVRCGA